MMGCSPRPETERWGSDTGWRGNRKEAERRKAVREKPRVRYNGKNRGPSDFSVVALTGINQPFVERNLLSSLLRCLVSLLLNYRHLGAACYALWFLKHKMPLISQLLCKFSS